MGKVYLKTPRVEDLYYRQEWMKDKKTMSYNAGFDLNLKGYDKVTGTIIKSDADMLIWYNNWINKEPDRFFAYIYDEEIEEPIGEVYYYPDNGIHSMGILIQDKFRKRGYGEKALLELEKIAFEKNNINVLSDYIPEDRNTSVKTFKKAGFIQTENYENVLIFDKEKISRELLITKEMYLKK